ncbi:hypothetical protein [Clostridium drakei]|nr:hypothetical protein [Clostridium drakei]
MEFKVIGEVENLSVSYYERGVSVVAKEGLIGLEDKHGKVIIN